MPDWFAGLGVCSVELRSSSICPTYTCGHGCRVAGNWHTVTSSASPAGRGVQRAGTLWCMTTIAVLGAGKVGETLLSGPAACAVAALAESAGEAPGILAVVQATMARLLRTAGNLAGHLHG